MVEYTFTFAGFMPKHELTPIGTFSNGDESINQTRTHMRQHIYKSEFATGPEATERQDRLFTADLEYAIDKGYDYIQMSNGKVFQIIEDGLVEVNITEEDLQELEEIKQSISSVADENYCRNCHNLMLIDGILNNTLSGKSDITLEQAHAMVKLAQLKHLLIGAR